MGTGGEDAVVLFLGPKTCRRGGAEAPARGRARCCFSSMKPAADDGSPHRTPRRATNAKVPVVALGLIAALVTLVQGQQVRSRSPWCVSAIVGTVVNMVDDGDLARKGTTIGSVLPGFTENVGYGLAVGRQVSTVLFELAVSTAKTNYGTDLFFVTDTGPIQSLRMGGARIEVVQTAALWLARDPFAADAQSRLFVDVGGTVTWVRLTDISIDPRGATQVGISDVRGGSGLVVGFAVQLGLRFGGVTPALRINVPLTPGPRLRIQTGPTSAFDSGTALYTPASFSLGLGYRLP